MGDQEWIGGEWQSGEPAAAQTDRQETMSAAKPSSASRPSVIDELADARAARSRPVTEASQVEEVTPEPTSDDLEDLIQNRVPMDLTQAQLPLRVTLFGRPAGPRRLRIDAAHTQIAAPNFAAGSRAHRDSTVHAESASTGSAPPVDESASLDRALNSLHEQDHS